jgi:hypothetical protein
LNDNQCLFPVRPEAAQYHPEKSVGNSQARTRISPFQDSKLRRAKFSKRRSQRERKNTITGTGKNFTRHSDGRHF